MTTKKMQRVFFFQTLLNTDFVSEVDLNLNSKAVPLVMILAKQERLRIILQHFQLLSEPDRYTQVRYP